MSTGGDVIIVSETGTLEVARKPHTAEKAILQEYLLSAVLGTPAIVLVLVLDFFGRGKHADCQQRSKIENENEDEDDWKVPIPR